VCFTFLDLRRYRRQKKNGSWFDHVAATRLRAVTLISSGTLQGLALFAFGSALRHWHLIKIRLFIGSARPLSARPKARGICRTQTGESVSSNHANQTHLAIRLLQGNGVARMAGLGSSLQVSLCRRLTLQRDQDDTRAMALSGHPIFL
jgi:hypothetical protein